MGEAIAAPTSLATDQARANIPVGPRADTEASVAGDVTTVHHKSCEVAEGAPATAAVPWSDAPWQPRGVFPRCTPVAVTLQATGSATSCATAVACPRQQSFRIASPAIF